MKYNDSTMVRKENDMSHARAMSLTGRWGAQAAGCIFLAKDTKRILLSYRSKYVNEPNEWGSWGGAIDNKETPVEAVKREVKEEAKYKGAFELIPLVVFREGTFKYYNFLAIVDTEFIPKLDDLETENYEWVDYGKWPTPLHSGLQYLIDNSGNTIVKKIKELYSLTEKVKSGRQLRGIWYHGTSSKYLKNILTQGLIPDPKEKSWNVDPDASSATLDRTTYGGVYVTKNLGTARRSAWRTSKKTNTNSLIVILDLQPKSLIADEDAVANHFVGYSDSNALWFYKIIKHGTEFTQYKQDLDNERERFANKTLETIKQLNNINNPKLESILKNLIKYDGFDAMVTRIAAYLDMSSYYNSDMWYRNWDDRKIKRTNIPLPPAKHDGERVFRSFIDQLTRTLKSITKSSDRFAPTGRSLDPIRFTGNNKIVCILEIMPNKDSHEILKLRYGKVPQDFVDQYKNNINSTFEIDQIIK